MTRRPAKLLLPLLALLLLCACARGNPLPEGMEEEAVLEQGRVVVTQLQEGDWEGVYGQLRQDARETSSPEEIEAYVSKILSQAGELQRETQAMATGQALDSGEAYATAVLCYRHRKKMVVYRVAFDTSMELLGLTMTTR